MSLVVPDVLSSHWQSADQKCMCLGLKIDPLAQVVKAEQMQLVFERIGIGIIAGQKALVFSLVVQAQADGLYIKIMGDVGIGGNQHVFNLRQHVPVHIVEKLGKATMAHIMVEACCEYIGQVWGIGAGDGLPVASVAHCQPVTELGGDGGLQIACGHDWFE